MSNIEQHKPRSFPQVLAVRMQEYLNCKLSLQYCKLRFGVGYLVVHYHFNRLFKGKLYNVYKFAVVKTLLTED